MYTINDLDDETRNKAEKICRDLGISLESYIDMALHALIRYNGIPFRMTLNYHKPNHPGPRPGMNNRRGPQHKMGYRDDRPPRRPFNDRPYNDHPFNEPEEVGIDVEEDEFEF